MPYTFINREPSKPGRVRIVPEDGSAPFYAVMERADEPTTEGSPLNAESLNAAQETLVYLDSESVHTHKRVYLSPAGNDANTGDSAETPMATIKAAIRKYAKWHKYVDLQLLDGTYTEDLGILSVDTCCLTIRSNSENKDAVTINMSTMLESHIQLLRLFNLTLNMTATGTRLLSINAGVGYATGVRFQMPANSSSGCINVYNASSLWLTDCIINAGTGTAVYGNPALHIRAINCTSERTLTRGFYANTGSVIEYTATLTATQMTYEASGGKCIELAARAGSTNGSMASITGQYMTYDGLLIQWGTASITPTAANEPTGTTVTFPFPYSGTPLVVASAVSTVPHNVSVGVVRSGDLVSDPKVEVGLMVVRSNTTATSVTWLAIGKGVM